MSFKVGKMFLLDPWLRITPHFCLNDPFEFCPPEDIEIKINAVLNQSDVEAKSSDINKFQRFMDSHGIVSLAKLKNNLLMWSHYADEHKGIVVEFEVDTKNPLSMFNTNSMPKSSDASFGQVKYRRSRKPYRKINGKSLSWLRYYYYLSKSVEWKYEKEYRFILPFTSANKAIIPTEHLKNNGCYKKLKTFDPVEGSKYSEISIESMLAEDIELLLRVWLESKKNGAMFFVRAHECNIKRIFVGANADCKELNPLIKEVFGGISSISYFDVLDNKFYNVEKTSMHKNRYKLDFRIYE